MYVFKKQRDREIVPEISTFIPIYRLKHTNYEGGKYSFLMESVTVPEAVLEEKNCFSPPP